MDFSWVKKLTTIHLCYAISFFTSGFIITLIQGVLFITLRNFNKYWYRKINYYLSYSFFSQIVFLVEWWSAGDIYVYVDQDDFKKYYGKEHAYLVMNHSYEIDWLMGWKFCDKVEVLGNCKAYAKNSIQYVPPIGWMWKFGEFVFLQRSFDKDKEIIKKQISELGDYPDPIWLLIYPEGTRFTPKKHEISQKFAQEKGLPLLKHHLTPRTKGFTTSLQAMKGKFPAVYDVQLAFSQKEKDSVTVNRLLMGQKIIGHLYFNRIPLEDIPEDEELAAKWLHELYQKKDRMSDSFANTDDFFKESGVERLVPFKIGRRYYSLLNTVGWAIVILVPMLKFLFGLLLSGELLYFSIAIAILSAFHFLLQHVIGMSKISKGSSYGTEKEKK